MKVENYKIEFEDNGQDFLIWTLDHLGFVIGCEPFQFSVWEGCWVDTEELKELKPGDQLYFKDPRGKDMQMKHRIENIKIL